MDNSGDHISWEVAFNVVFKLIPKVDDDGCCWVIRGDAATAIDSIPAADVRPVVRGKWIPDYDYAEYDFDGSTPLTEPLKFQDGWQCSLCGGYMPSETNFCPKCGADMRGESDV